MGAATTDFLIIGGGVIGLTLALEARRRHPGASVTLIEKEHACGLHASGRNSGVLHAGFYYSPDSLKARFTREGNRRLTAYCTERGLRLRPCGKLVVARDERDHAGLDELLRRARANGVELHEVSEAEARRIEPNARTCERALFSPTTSAVDPAEVVRSLVSDARQAGVVIRTGTAFRERGQHTIRTSTGDIAAGYVINAAGLYADRIARAFGFSRRHRILPFKGLYLYAREHPGIRVHIYPVPSLDYPFLGVHFTVTAHDKVKIGPTALPALWREQYGGLRNFRVDEFAEIARRQATLVAGSPAIRRLAVHELAKRSRRRMLELAAELVSTPLPVSAWRAGEPGIRAQLYDIERRKLEMDFVLEGDGRSFHVLNAVSPAFTSSLPFAEYAFDEIERRAGTSSPVHGRQEVMA